MDNVSEETMLSWTSLQETMSASKKRAMRALLAEYTSLLKEPSEGFVVKVDDPFSWDVGIYGPPSTPYWGGYFKLQVTFPDDYPFEPPKLKFKSRFWHPNVYHNGAVCMSILHDPHAEEIPTDLPRDEKWNPTLSVRTVLLSLISILGSPNPDSPANPEASKMYRSWLKDGDQDYVKVIEDIVKRSMKTASRDGVTVPKTLDDYLTKPKPKINEPLINYSSDSDGNYSSDKSDLLSLPSSEDSDQDVFHDSESSWVPNSETQNSLFSHPLEHLSSEPIVIPNSVSDEGHQDAINRTDSIRNTDEVYVQRNIIRNSLPLLTENIIPTSLPVLDNKNILSNDYHSSLSQDTQESFASLCIHQEPINEPRISEENAESRLGCNEAPSTNGNIPSTNVGPTDLTRINQSVPLAPLTNRKRRRPPRLYISSQKTDMKKRKKQ